MCEHKINDFQAHVKIYGLLCKHFMCSIYCISFLKPGLSILGVRTSEAKIKDTIGLPSFTLEQWHSAIHLPHLSNFCSSLCGPLHYSAKHRILRWAHSKASEYISIMLHLFASKYARKANTKDPSFDKIVPWCKPNNNKLKSKLFENHFHRLQPHPPASNFGQNHLGNNNLCKQSFTIY